MVRWKLWNFHFVSLLGNVLRVLWLLLLLLLFCHVWRMPPWCCHVFFAWIMMLLPWWDGKCGIWLLPVCFGLLIECFVTVVCLWGACLKLLLFLFWQVWWMPPLVYAYVFCLDNWCCSNGKVQHVEFTIVGFSLLQHLEDVFINLLENADDVDVAQVFVCFLEGTAERNGSWGCFGFASSVCIRNLVRL